MTSPSMDLASTSKWERSLLSWVTTALGKTTTLGMLSGMVCSHVWGTRRFLGHSIVDELSSVRTMLGVCPQHDIVWPKLTGPEHLYVYGRIKGMSESEAEAEAKVWLEKVGLGDETDKLVEGYSGGMKRKLSVAISLIGGSRVIFLDECTAGMDPYSRHKVWELLQELKSERVIIMTNPFSWRRLMCWETGFAS